MVKRKECDTEDSAAENSSLKRARPSSPTMANSQLKPVRELIETVFDHATDSLRMKAYALHAAFSDVSIDPQWKEALNPDFVNMENCHDALLKNEELASTINECISKKDWQPIFDHPGEFNILLRGYHLILPNAFRIPS